MNTEATIKVGIDNGLDGAAFAIFPDRTVSFLRFNDRPKILCEPFSVVGSSSINDWLIKIAQHGRLEVIIEAPALNQGKGSTATSIASTASSFSLILNLLLRYCSHDLIWICPAVTWQKHFWKSNQKHESKPSIRLAEEIFGKIFVYPGCRVPHDGTTDAALMAQLLTMPVNRQRLIDDLNGKVEKKAKAKAKAKALRSKKPVTLYEIFKNKNRGRRS